MNENKKLNTFIPPPTKTCIYACRDTDNAWNLNRYNVANNKFVLSDGTQVLMMYNTTLGNSTCTGTNWSSDDACGHIFVDINGSKGPNQFGRDLSLF